MLAKCIWRLHSLRAWDYKVHMMTIEMMDLRPYQVCIAKIFFGNPCSRLKLEPDSSAILAAKSVIICGMFVGLWLKCWLLRLGWTTFSQLSESDSIVKHSAANRVQQPGCSFTFRAWECIICESPLRGLFIFSPDKIWVPQACKIFKFSFGPALQLHNPCSIFSWSHT